MVGVETYSVLTQPSLRDNETDLIFGRVTQKFDESSLVNLLGGNIAPY